MMNTDTPTEKKHPTHTVYFLTEKKGESKKIWNETGVAWINKDQDGLNLSLRIMGQQIPLVIRKNKPKE